MYSNAELFNLAMTQKKQIFIGNVTTSIPDDADGSVDLDAEKRRLSNLWDVSRMSMNQIIDAACYSNPEFSKLSGVPLRTVQAWYAGTRQCPDYVRFLLAEHFDLI